MRSLKKKKFIKKSFENFAQNFEKILGKVPQIITLETELQSSLKSKKDETSGIENKVKESQNRLSTLEGQIRANEEHLKKMENQLKDNKQKIQTYCPDNRALPDLVKEAEELVKKKMNTLTLTQHTSVMYKKFIEAAKQDHECPLCERAFKDQKEFEDFSQKLTTTVEKVPENLVTQKNTLKEAETSYSNLRSLLPLWEEIQKLEQNEVPNLKQKLTDFAKDRKKKNIQLQWMI